MIGGDSTSRTLLPFKASSAKLVALLQKADDLQSIQVPMNGQAWQAALQAFQDKASRKKQAQKTKGAGNQKKNT